MSNNNWVKVESWVDFAARGEVPPDRIVLPVLDATLTKVSLCASCILTYQDLKGQEWHLKVTQEEDFSGPFDMWEITKGGQL